MALQNFNLAAQNYPLDYAKINCQQTINMFVDVDEGGGGRTQNFLRSTPGLKKWKDILDKCRGFYVDSRNYLWTIEGQKVVRRQYVPDNFVENNAEYNKEDLTEERVVGAIYNTDPLFKASFSECFEQLVIVDGENLYVYIYADDTFQQYNPSGWQGSYVVENFYNMFVFVKPDSKQFYASAFRDATNILARDFIEKDSTSDNLITLKSYLGNLWAFGTSSIQVYSFNASAGSELAITQAGGQTYQIGCLSQNSIQQINNVMVFVGADKNGKPLLFATSGDVPQKISNLSVERMLQEIDDFSDVTSWSYQEYGHYFYCLNLPKCNTTLVYDFTTKIWHERQYLLENGNTSRHRADGLVLWRNMYLVYDYEKSIIYEMNTDFLDDDGNPIQRIRRSSQVFSTDKLARISEFKLDCIVGNIVDTDEEPKIYLRCSKDGGNSWGNMLEKGMGKKGDYLKEIRWFNPCGAFKELVIELSTTDKCRFTILNAYANIF